MSANKNMIEIHADTQNCAILKNYLQAHNLIDSCKIIKNKENRNIILRHHGQEKTFAPPLRLGTLLDQINQYISSDQKPPPRIDFITGHLDIHQGIFVKNTNKKIALTEKEVDILSFLHSNQGTIISRETLLSAIWNYADNVETHTLETHIYRLRQKIEENPTVPKILITEEDGYCIH